MSPLYDEIDKLLLRCPITDNQYIPLDTLNQKITWPAVKQLLPSTLGRRLLPRRRKSDLENKIQEAKKIIAILVLIGQSSAIETLLSEELKDEDLPLCRNGDNMQSQCSKKIFTSFADWERGAVGMFLEKQWMVLEPTWKLDATTAINIQLPSHHCPLKIAFSSCIEVTKPENSTAHVYKVVLRPGSRLEFDDKSKEGASGSACVAFKTFERNRMSDFVKEKDILDKIHSTGIKNEHLIGHLAICDRIPCIIFPWADGGDLADFWQQEGPKPQSVFLWSLRQMSGLAHALEELHGMNCRHGDLKPANILYFSENGVGILKIADLGVARAHNQATDLRYGKTITSASTRVYEGPEAYKSNYTPRSRLYDCWSMGCIILEFVLWLLYDFRALQSFLEARVSDSHGYYQPKPGPQSADPLEKTEVHPMAHVAMEYLLHDPRCCGTALEGLVKIVKENLLKITPTDRLEAADLHQQLQAIVERAQIDRSYLVNEVDRPQDIPAIFSKRPLHSTQEFTYQ